jgi:hypothetical protein
MVSRMMTEAIIAMSSKVQCVVRWVIQVYLRSQDVVRSAAKEVLHMLENEEDFLKEEARLCFYTPLPLAALAYFCISNSKTKSESKIVFRL